MIDNPENQKEGIQDPPFWTKRLLKERIASDQNLKTLNEKLKAAVAEVARKTNVNSYDILKSKTINLITVKKPNTREELAGIKGVDDKVLGSLGDVFLEIINKSISDSAQHLAQESSENPNRTEDELMQLLRDKNKQ